MTHKTRNEFWRVVTAVLAVQVFGLMRCPAPPVELRKATQAEINSGAKVNAFVDPYGLSQWTGGGGGGGPTNGQTAQQVTNIVKGTLVPTNNVSYWNATNTATFNGNVIAANITGIAKFIAGTHVLTNVPNAAGVLADDGTEAYAFTTAPFISGANFTSGTVNSNALDAATKAQLFAVGGLSQAQFTLGLGAGTNTGNFTSGLYSGILTASQLVTPGNVGITNLDGGDILFGSLASPDFQVGLEAADGDLHFNSQNGGNFKFSGNVQMTGTLTPNQANIATAWLTNVVMPTNAFAGTVVDFARGNGMTNLGGNLTFTALANVTAGGANTAIIRLLSGGADRTIAFPTGWHTNFNFIGVVTNGWQMDLLFTVYPGIRTNVAQVLYP